MTFDEFSWLGGATKTCMTFDEFSWLGGATKTCMTFDEFSWLGGPPRLRLFVCLLFNVTIVGEEM